MCKYYQGPGEKDFENELKRLFHRVYREKPESSRSVSLLYQLMFLCLPGLANEICPGIQRSLLYRYTKKKRKISRKLEFLGLF